MDSQPVYVQKPFANYLDPGYGAFQTTWANRAPMVYVGGNDGMLHAFNAVVNPPLPSTPIDTQAGMEKWAVIPSTVLPNMYQLADSAYVAPANHRFFVDGTPVAADIDIDGSGNWRTILVGGLNAGGKGYYAIDVTDPSVLPPKALWEFKQDTAQCPSPALGPYSASVAAQSTITGDCHLGLTFGKPVVTKLAGRWVVMFASGYNNDDGVGYLYVVDAYTGKLIQKIATPAVSGADAGLAQINNYVNNALVDNTTVRAYGGDLLGRVWRFDFAGAGSAQLIGTAQDSGSTPQPITTRVELAELNGKPMVFVGTGQLLGTADIANMDQQSVYGIVDPLTSVGGPIYSPLRTSLSQLKMTQIGTGAGAKRTVACASGSHLRQLRRLGGRLPGRGADDGEGRAGQRRDEAHSRYACRRQQRAHQRRLYRGRPQLVQLPQLQRRTGGGRCRPERRRQPDLGANRLGIPLGFHHRRLQRHSVATAGGLRQIRGSSLKSVPAMASSTPKSCRFLRRRSKASESAGARSSSRDLASTRADLSLAVGAGGSPIQAIGLSPSRFLGLGIATATVLCLHAGLLFLRPDVSGSSHVSEARAMAVRLLPSPAIEVATPPEPTANRSLAALREGERAEPVKAKSTGARDAPPAAKAAERAPMPVASVVESRPRVERPRPVARQRSCRRTLRLPPSPTICWARGSIPGHDRLDSIEPEYPESANLQEGKVVLRLLISDTAWWTTLPWFGPSPRDCSRTPRSRPFARRGLLRGWFWARPSRARSR